VGGCIDVMDGWMNTSPPSCDFETNKHTLPVPETLLDVTDFSTNAVIYN